MEIQMGEVTINLDMNGLAKWDREFLEKFPASVTRGLHVGAKRVVKLLKERTLSVGIWDRGKMFRGWRMEMLSHERVRVFNKEKHAIYVEAGRRIGALPPPLTPIMQWVMRKFGVDKKEAKHIAYAVAQAISKKGIPARPVMMSPGMPHLMATTVAKTIDESVMATMAGKNMNTR
jgi:hypothetical protein